MFNPQILHAVLRELVRQTVEDTLNGLLEEEADDLVGAERHGRTAGREAYRAGHYDRKLVTTSGEVTARMPKLKGMRFTTAIIERYRRRETSVEEAMIEMRLAGVSTRRIEDFSEALWGASVSSRLARTRFPSRSRSAILYANGGAWPPGRLGRIATPTYAWTGVRANDHAAWLAARCPMPLPAWTRPTARRPYAQPYCT